MYRVWEAVVTSYKSSVSFHHDTNQVLDRDAQLSWPAAFWTLPTAALSPAASVYQDGYKFHILFADQTASDRSPEEMMRAHARMEAIAKHCFLRFSDRYITDSTEFEGVLIDLELIGTPTFTPEWDQSGTMYTGVVLSCQVKATQVECVDAYFV